MCDWSLLFPFDEMIVGIEWDKHDLYGVVLAHAVGEKVNENERNWFEFEWTVVDVRKVCRN